MMQGPLLATPFLGDGLSHNVCGDVSLTLPTISLMHKMDEEEAYLVIR